MPSDMKKLIFILLPSLLISLASCKGYDEGPFLSFKKPETRIVNSWIPEVVLDESGYDITDQYDDVNYVYMSNGIVEVNKLVAGVYQSQYSGTWELTEDKEKIVLRFSGNFSSGSDTLLILRLKSKSFWYVSSYGKEFHLIPEAH